jgi:hypothetical protein
MAVGLAAGDITAGAVGTVAYRDGDTVWGFGHQLDGAGRRSLLLQDAYVYGVVDGPGFLEGSAKLAAPVHALGTLGNDTANAVVGRLGTLPRTVPLEVVARDADRGRITRLHVQVADESALDDPAGTSPLRLATDLAVAQAAGTALDGAPSRQTARMCVRIALRDRPIPLGFCNRYVIDAPSDVEVPESGMAELLAGDADQAIALLDGNTFAALPVASVHVSLRLHRGLDQALLLGARAARTVHPGQRVRVRLALRRFRGRAFHTTIGLRVPRDLHAGRHVLLLRGRGLDASDFGFGLIETFYDAFGDEADDRAGSLPELFWRVHDIARYDGLRAGWITLGHRHAWPFLSPAYRSPRERISGTAAVPVRVVRRR